MPELQSTATRAGRFWYWALVLCVTVALPVAAQETVAPDQSEKRPESSTTSTNLLDGLGKLFKSPAELLSPSKPDAAPKSDAVQQTPPPPVAPSSAAPAPADPPATASSQLLPGVATGRVVCPRTSNGAPDCQTGANKLCQSKGYKNGKSLNTDSAFSCSARQARAEGQKPCGTEYFVTGAFCQ